MDLEPTLLERRSQVRLRRRPNLGIEPHVQAGRRSYVVKDPVSLQYFHLSDVQHFALSRMDGRHTLEQIRDEFEAEFKPQRLSLDEIEAFARQLLQSGLVENEGAGDGRRLHDQYQKQQRWRRWLFLAKIFYYQVPLLRPDQVLDPLIPFGRLLFHPLTALGVALGVLAACGLIVTRWNEFLQRLPSYAELFTVQHLLYLWLAVGLVKILHELGHGLCARTLGSDVHDTGIVFLFFFPTLYCNVTDTWMLPQKWKRLAITAAGVYVEMIVACMATFVWWSSDASSFVSQFSFWLIIVCGVQTVLFNANPLARFDGYFFLSDWMEVPNLAQTANRCCLHRLMRGLGMDTPPLPTAGSEPFLVSYAVASAVYRAMMLGGMLYAFYQLARDQRLAWLGSALVGVGVMAFLALPAYRLVRFFQGLGEVSLMRRSRLWLLAALTTGALAMIFLVPLPTYVRGVGLLQVHSVYQHRLVVPAPGGFLAQVFVRDGQRVRQGDVLAVLKNPEIDLQLRLLEADQALRSEQVQALVGQLAIFDVPGQDRESLAEIRQELRNLSQQTATTRAHREALTIRAPCDGIVMGFPSWETQGKWLPPGSPLCQVGDPAHLRVLVLLDPADRQLIEGTRPAMFHVHGGGPDLWEGEVTGVAQMDADEIPPPLAQRLGGDVATVKDAVSQAERPRKQHYLVSVRILQPDERLQIGALGQVRIDVGANTTWWRLRRFAGTTFHWGL